MMLSYDMDVRYREVDLSGRVRAAVYVLVLLLERRRVREEHSRLFRAVLTVVF